MLHNVKTIYKNYSNLAPLLYIKLLHVPGKLILSRIISANAMLSNIQVYLHCKFLKILGLIGKQCRYRSGYIENVFSKYIENLYSCSRYNYWKNFKTLCQKGEIAHFEQFLLFSQRFQKSSSVRKGLTNTGGQCA